MYIYHGPVEGKRYLLCIMSAYIICTHRVTCKHKKSEPGQYIKDIKVLTLGHYLLKSCFSSKNCMQVGRSLPLSISYTNFNQKFVKIIMAKYG